MTDDAARGIVSNVVIRASNDTRAFKASATVVLWGSVRLSGFRILAGVDGLVSVVWTERQSDGEYLVGVPPKSVPWDECQQAILAAYNTSQSP